MGRQICYYATPVDLERFFASKPCGDIVFLDQLGNKLEVEHLIHAISCDFNATSFGASQCYITKENLNIYHFPNENNSVDFQKSEVIQFSACKPSPQKIIDMSPITRKFSTEGFVVINDSEEYYRQLAKLLENPIYIENPHYIKNGFEHGRLWYAPDYYDDEGKKVNKTHELKSLYLSLEKYIKKQFRAAKDGFGYIGPSAYQMYLEGTFVPCSGKFKIKF